LVQYGYLDSSIVTQIVDLKKDQEELWADLRNSYKSLINKSDQTYETIIIDHKKPDFEIHEAYRLLHHKSAGGVTRPMETFNLQFEMLKEDEAMLVAIKFNGAFISFAYFLHSKKTAFYGSESDDPDIEVPVPFGPLMQWKAIAYYKTRGFDYLELGKQQFSPQIFHHPSKKHITISFYKRGFGGKMFPLFTGIKYYSKELLVQELTENMNKLAERSFKHDDKK
jgi:hypothetical protein